MTGIQVANNFKSEAYTMNPTLKLVSLLMLLLLASPVILLKGCGSKGGLTGGGPSGACPDSVAPSGSKIVVPTLPAPSIGAINCYPSLGFTVIDSAGNPMNGICVVVISNASIALNTTNDSNCSNAVTNPSSQIVTRTDGNGNVVVDMINSSPTQTAQTYFVGVSSGSLSNVATTPAAK